MSLQKKKKKKKKKKDFWQTFTYELCFANIFQKTDNFEITSFFENCCQIMIYIM